MRAVTRPAYLKGVGTRQALRRATTAGRERSRSSSSFRRRLPTESSWLGWPLPTGMCPSVTWLRRTNHDQSSLRAQACDSQCPAPARGCPAPPSGAPRTLVSIHLSRSELSGPEGSAAFVNRSRPESVGSVESPCS